MEFDINVIQKDGTTRSIKVKYGTLLSKAVTDASVILNQYGKPVPLNVPLRGPATFKIN